MVPDGQHSALVRSLTTSRASTGRSIRHLRCERKNLSAEVPWPQAQLQWRVQLVEPTISLMYAAAQPASWSAAPQTSGYCRSAGSTGRAWPDGHSCVAAGGVLLSAEDGLADTIRPRLDAAGGEPSRVLALDLVGDDQHAITLPVDLAFVEAAISRVGAQLVIIDPLMAFLAGDVNAHRDQDVRRALRPLAEMADRLHVAVLLIRHLNKAAGGLALYRGGGSIGIIGAARMGLIVGADPEDDTRRIFAPLKSNLSAKPESLAYRLVEATSGVVRVQWDGVSALTADQLLALPVATEDRSAFAEARDFLVDLLANGSVPSTDVVKHAHEAGISDRTLKRAKRDLGVVATKKGMKAGWGWSLGEEGHEIPKRANGNSRHSSEEVGPLRREPAPNGVDDLLAALDADARETFLQEMAKPPAERWQPTGETTRAAVVGSA